MARLARIAGAVLAGFFATAVLSVGMDAAMHASGVFPAVGVRMSDGLFGVAALYRAVFTVVGGWITARLAPKPATGAVWALVGLGLLGGGAGVAVSVANPELGPLWYAVSIPLSAAPCIWGGAWWAGRRAERPE